MLLNKIITALIVPAILFAENTVLSWEDCVKEAFAGNSDLKSAREKIFQAEQDLLVTQSGGALQVSAGLNENNSFPLTTGTYSASSGYSLSGTYRLYDGNQYYFDVAAAKEKVNAAKFAYEMVSASVRNNLRAAFIDLFNAQELISITEDIKNSRKENYDMVKLSYDAGMEHKGSVLLAEANYLQSDYEVTAAKRNLKLSSAKLMRQLGRKIENPAKVTSGFELTYDLKEIPDMKKLVQANPSYRQNQAQKAAADLNLQSARTAFSPQISLNGSAGKSVSNFSWTTPDLSAGISLSLPLVDGGLRAAQVDKATSLSLQADITLFIAAYDLEVSLLNSWISFQNAFDQIGVRKKFLEATKERAEIAEVQYSNGLINFDNFTIIEDDLVNAKKALLNAQINYLNAENSWLNAKGAALK